MGDKWSIKPILADKLAGIVVYLVDKETTTTEEIKQTFSLSDTTAKHDMRHLTEFGYLLAEGGNKSRVYRVAHTDGHCLLHDSPTSPRQLRHQMCLS